MKTLTFKTNIKCTGCVEKVKPALDQLVGVTHWDVDLEEADKVLTVRETQQIVGAQQIIDVLEKVGYKATMDS